MIKSAFKPQLITLMAFVFFISFFLSFYKNIFSVANPQWFNQFQKDSESLVIGRLIHAQENGLFSDAGLTGNYDHPDIKNKVAYQYQVFTKQTPLDPNKTSFGTYNSQIGGQATIFAMLNKVLPYGNLGNLITFYLLTSILSSLIFTLFLYWIAKNFGLATSLITFFFLLFSHWLVVFGRNLWWSLWSFYLPFICLLFILKGHTTQSINDKKQPILLFCMTFLLLFIKCFFTGFEYITTTVIMGGIPFIFYAVFYQWDKHKCLKYGATYILSAFSAIIFAFIILSIQLSVLLGGIRKGYEHLLYSFNKRTSGSGEGLPEIYKDSLQSDVMGVLGSYWNGTALNLNTLFQSKWSSLWQFSFGELILLFLLFSALALISEDISGKTFDNRKKNIALIVSTFVSMLAPMSWFIIFKGHSYIHLHMNYIVWYMPFLLFGFVIIGSVSVTLSQDAFSYCYDKFSKKVS